MKARTLILMAAAFLFSGTAFIATVAGEESDKKTEAAPQAVEPVDPHSGASATTAISGCLADEQAIEDIRKAREALQAREKELAARESELKAREAALTDELKKLEEARNQIAKIEGARRVESDERVNKLVETFETMSPKAAGQVLATLDDSLAVASMSKMATPKLAKVLNGMDPKRSSQLTELLAGVVRAREGGSSGRALTASNGAAETATHRKGGEKQYDEHGKQTDQQRVSGSAGASQPGSIRN